MSQGGGSFRADWYYAAADETRTFVLEYDVAGAAQKHADQAELYWKFIGTDWEVSSQTVRVTMVLPHGVGRAGVRAWAHGPLWGHVAVGGRES